MFGTRVWATFLLGACLGAVCAQKEKKVLENLRQNLACTWTDEDEGRCFLDYFQFMPESEIKDFYGADEACAFLEDSRKCEKDSNCEWLKAGESGKCVAKIPEDDLIACAKEETENIEMGKLCGVFKIKDSCGSLKKKKKCEKKCEWDKGVCFPRPKTIATMEFKGDKTAAEFVLDSQKRCLSFSTREECENTALHSE